LELSLLFSWDKDEAVEKLKAELINQEKMATDKLNKVQASFKELTDTYQLAESKYKEITEAYNEELKKLRHSLKVSTEKEKELSKKISSLEKRLKTQEGIIADLTENNAVV